MIKILHVFAILFISVVPFATALSQDLTISLGRDTTLCQGETIILEAKILNAEAGMVFSYEWNNEPSDSPFFTITQGGKYWVKVTDAISGFSGIDTIEIFAVENPEFDIVLPDVDYFCKGENIALITNVAQANWLFRWEWNNRIALTDAVIADTTTEAILTVTDENNCRKVKSVNVNFQYPWEEDKILLSTYDPTEDRNVVIWRKTSGKRTQSYVMFRGIDPDNLLRTVSFNEINLVVDTQWDPKSGPAFYNCQVLDSCNNRSTVRSDWVHRTMHLSVERIAENLTILEWNRYFGFDYQDFDILGGTEPGNLTVIATVKVIEGNIRYTYTDATNAQDNFIYQIRINTPEPVYLDDAGGKKAGAGPFVHSFSNLEDNLMGTGIGSFLVQSKLNVYPNPYTGSTNISYVLDNPGVTSIEVYNLLGQRVVTLHQGNQESGSYNFNFSARDYGYSSGIYFLKFEVKGAGTFMKKMVER